MLFWVQNISSVFCNAVTRCNTASSSSRTLVDLNSFSSLIYFALLYDILLAPLDNL